MSTPPSASLRVYVTGATGLIGSHLVEELRARGYEVVALHRRGADVSHLREHGCTLVEGDVRDDADALVEGMEGCDRVVHAVALVYAGGAWPKIRAVNVDGTRNVLTAAVRAGVGHAVHISSVAAYGSAGDHDEEAPLESDLPPGDLYARSKREAEEVARGIEEQRGLRVTILRPSAVYGERDRLMIPALLPFMRSPLVPLLGPGTNPLPVVYAGNVAVAIRLALEAAVGGTVYDVGMDHPLDQRTLFEGLAEGLGRRARFFSLPAPLLRGGGAVLSRLGIDAPGAQHLSIDRVLDLALGENPFPSRRIREELGWEPPYDHRPALARSGQWAAEHA